MLDFIHNDPDFGDLLAIVSSNLGVDITLVEKDYWIMHALYSLKQQNIEFELKGGTSLSKGYGLIHRFSEDIDIHIRTNFGLAIEGKEDKRSVIDARKQFYDVLANNIIIDGIVQVERDYEFDDLLKYRSGGIRLYYKTRTPILDGLKEGILLEAGFDTITPNSLLNISSWVWEHLVSIDIHSKYKNNTALAVPCYHPGFTLIEKLQTIIRKFRNMDKGSESTEKNFMRQYYDVYCLLGDKTVIEFIGSQEYLDHKLKRIKGDDKLIQISENPAFLLGDGEIRMAFENKYKSTAKLYYKGQPPFSEVLERIHHFLPAL
ncbi:nucleotidyl transferase AbiEii/AbiGii toxin family protein [Aquirufa antheringensis]|uniref:nucleotidyl transferase AbiEii/AbiGii toxin family protein n=1 Tax=Aquirufa antheringensis TaxID=2516559 RepID=UPI001F858DF0|nr:nucleotidyl transferase AbiEii/AbiGii toxin family protein [Aquirufa antheringensis]MCE4217603.1 nucleotidyl transferase AbiEii/AbiGii toxin family protein [Pseudarcicella sp. GAP-15]MCZ2478028.1 nucleotidyl transferase AbiEii/AbiGii toxin family protein [Aquirufa antheringensis]